MASGVTRDTILRSSVAETLLSLTLFTPENASKVSRTEPLFTQKTDVSHLNVWLIQEHEKEVKI